MRRLQLRIIRFLARYAIAHAIVAVIVTASRTTVDRLPPSRQLRLNLWRLDGIELRSWLFDCHTCLKHLAKRIEFCALLFLFDIRLFVVIGREGDVFDDVLVVVEFIAKGGDF